MRLPISKGRTFARVIAVWAATTLAWPASADATPPRDDHARRVLSAFSLIQSWRVEEARPAVEAALEASPDDPLTLALVGQMRFHLGDYPGAVDAFNRARALGAPPQLLIDADAAEKARVTTEGYEEHLGEHFVIRYPPGKDALLVPFAEEALEAARARIGELLGFTPSERVVVEIYPTAKTLATVSALTPKDIETSGTIALCRWNRLMATTPRAVVFGYAWRDTLAHELTHLIIGGASRDTVPIWLHEGLAKYAETAWRGEPGLGISVEQQKKLREAAKKGELIPFSAMHPSMAKLPSQEAASLAFTEVFTFIEFLVEKKGWPGIRQLLREMASGKSDAEAIASVYGSSLRELERRWRRTLPTRPIRARDNLRAVKGERKLVIKDRADTPDDELHGLDAVARRHARAADLLYARGRYVAAQRELERAFDESRSPLVSAKLATLALANDDLERAEEAARRSIESMPELAGPNVTLAEILLRRGKTSEMDLPLARALDINPFDPRIHELLLAAHRDRPGSKAAAQAKRALELTALRHRAAGPLDLGRGARITVEGVPFSRVYLVRDGERFPTLMVTPTAPIELRPGAWTVELQPPKGPILTREVRVEPSDEVERIRVTAPSGARSSR